MQNHQPGSRARDCRCCAGENGQGHRLIGLLPQLPDERVGEFVFANKADQAFRSKNLGPANRVWLG